MSQVDVLERLYFIPELTPQELSVILNLNVSSIEQNVSRLKKSNYIRLSDKKRGYVLTGKGKEFYERYFK